MKDCIEGCAASIHMPTLSLFLRRADNNLGNNIFSSVNNSSFGWNSGQCKGLKNLIGAQALSYGSSNSTGFHP